MSKVSLNNSRYGGSPLLSRRTGDGRAQLARSAKVRCAVGVEVDLLSHSVSVAIASSCAVGSRVVHIPDLLTVRAGKETRSLSAYVPRLHESITYPLCPGP